MRRRKACAASISFCAAESRCEGSDSPSEIVRNCTRAEIWAATLSGSTGGTSSDERSNSVSLQSGSGRRSTASRNARSVASAALCGASIVLRNGETRTRASRAPLRQTPSQRTPDGAQPTTGVRSSPHIEPAAESIRAPVAPHAARRGAVRRAFPAERATRRFGPGRMTSRGAAGHAERAAVEGPRAPPARYEEAASRVGQAEQGAAARHEARAANGIYNRTVCSTPCPAARRWARGGCEGVLSAGAPSPGRDVGTQHALSPAVLQPRRQR